MKIDKDLFEIMLDEWKYDNPDLVSDLTFLEIYYDEDLGTWASLAEDDTTQYVIADVHGTGDIRLYYAGTK